MFGGSYFGGSPFASPPTVTGVVKQIIKWAAGLPGGLWSAMRTRSGWSTDTPQSNIQTPRGLDP